VQSQNIDLEMLKDSSIYHLDKYISKNFEVNSELTQNMCLRGWFFVKVEMGRYEKFYKIAFSIGTPRAIKESFERVITSMNTFWDFDKVNLNPNLVILKPIYFDFWAGCDDKNKPYHLAIFPENEKYWQNSRLFFDDNTNYATIECVFLSEIYSRTICVKK
jgi:hypothetical protein